MNQDKEQTTPNLPPREFLITEAQGRLDALIISYINTLHLNYTEISLIIGNKLAEVNLQAKLDLMSKLNQRD